MRAFYKFNFDTVFIEDVYHHAKYLIILVHAQQEIEIHCSFILY